jgi:hypothetical protein
MNLQFALAAAGCSSGFYLLCKMLLQIVQTILEEETDNTGTLVYAAILR